MITENESVVGAKKPRKPTVTVVVGPQTVLEIGLLIASHERRNPMAQPWSVSDVVGVAVNLGLTQMGYVTLGEGGVNPVPTHSEPHGPESPCHLGCAGYRLNHYA